MVFIFAVVRRIINEPSAINQMELGSPDVIGVFASRRRAPNTHTLILPDAGDSPGTADEDMPFVPGLGIVIVTAVENRPRVGRMGWQDRIDNFASF